MTCNPIQAAEKPSEQLTIIAKENQSIRDIAREYLNDPDLWVEILRHNDLSASKVSEVSAGTALKIPFTQVSNANKALIDSLEVIQSATAQGAKVFAPKLIETATLGHDNALQAKKAGEWKKCVSFANSAKKNAKKALLISTEQRNVAIEALLTNRQGKVQSKKPVDRLWQSAQLNAQLIESEKIRTLSDSLAEVTFLDGSRLGLNENSQAIIQKMRVDRLKRKKEASVVLLEGDVYALLGGNGRKNNFSFKTPGIDTTIESKNFWASRDSKSTQFANYDTRKIKLASKGSSVTLGKNQGAVVPHKGRPGNLVDLLPEPAPIAPAEGHISFQPRIKFTWASLSGAVSYWLEIATDPSFRSTILSRRNIRTTSHTIEKISLGDYFWRVTAFDTQKLPGESSPARHLTVQNDTLEPYLAIFSPPRTGMVKNSSVSVTGETESGVHLTLNGNPIGIGAKGRFSTDVALQKGKNELRFKAVDLADHTTQRLHSLVFIPKEPILIHYSANLPQIATKHFVTMNKILVLSGRTAPDARIVARAESGIFRASTYADQMGEFDFNLPLESKKERLTLVVTLPTGEFNKDSIQVTRDELPPQIQLDKPPPALTTNENLLVKGQVIDGTQLIVNGQPVKLIAGRFKEWVDLLPGNNQLELHASDLAGNATRLTFKTTMDKDPPKLLNHKLTALSTATGKMMRIWVRVTDNSALKRTAAFDLQVGSQIVSGHLRLMQADSSYRATILVPQQTSNSVRLKSVELRDYLNNGERYVLNK